MRRASGLAAFFLMDCRPSFAQRQTIATRVVTHNSAILQRSHVALAAEKLTPVAIVSQAATHNGHFGRNTNAAAGKSDAVTLESRRGNRCDARRSAQHCPIITHLCPICASCRTRRDGATRRLSHCGPWEHDPATGTCPIAHPLRARTWNRYGR